MESESLPGGFGHPAATARIILAPIGTAGRNRRASMRICVSAAEWWFAIAIHAAGFRIKGAQPGADNTAAHLSGFLCGQFAGPEAAEYSVGFIGHNDSPWILKSTFVLVGASWQRSAYSVHGAGGWIEGAAADDKSSGHFLNFFLGQFSGADAAHYPIVFAVIRHEILLSRTFRLKIVFCFSRPGDYRARP